MNNKKNKVIECCDCTVIHEDVVKIVKETFPDKNTIVNLARFYKTIGVPTRIKILWALDTAELCVCDISVLLNMTQSAISHQLKILKEEKLVKNRRVGKIVYYSLHDEHVKQIFEIGLVHTSELKA